MRRLKKSTDVNHLSSSYIKAFHICSWSSNLPSEREYIFNFRNVCVHFSKEEMGMKEVLEQAIYS